MYLCVRVTRAGRLTFSLVNTPGSVYKEQSEFQVQAASTSSQVASSSYVKHSVNPSGQSFSAGQFHNCIFNIKYCSN